jgi:hypothetical protein
VRPSWLPPDDAGAIGRRVPPSPPPVALVAAAAGVVVLAGLEALEVAGRDDLRPGMRAVLVAVVALQLPWAWLALRRSAAAAMVLLLCGVMALLAGLAGGAWGVAAAGAAVVALVARSLRWFPPVDAWPS